MVLDLLTLTAIPTIVGASEAVHQQGILDEDAESEERQTPFYLDVFCDAQSRKRDEVHDAIVILKDGNLRLWPRDSRTNFPKDDPHGKVPPHPFTGFYLPFPTDELPHQPIPAPPILGLVSTVPPDPANSKQRHKKPKLNWIYADKQTREVKYGSRIDALEHLIGPWDWTEDDAEGLTLCGEECLVAVEEEGGGMGWAIYWDQQDDRLKGFEVGEKKRVLRCSLERRLVHEEPKSEDNV